MDRRITALKVLFAASGMAGLAFCGAAFVIGVGSDDRPGQGLTNFTGALGAIGAVLLIISLLAFQSYGGDE